MTSCSKRKRSADPWAPSPCRRARPASVSISNEESDFYTIADVAANDRLGLLHDLTRVIARARLRDLHLEGRNSAGPGDTDTFYLKDAHGKKLRNAEGHRAAAPS